MLNLLTNNTSASTATTCSGSSASNNSTSSSAAQQLLSQLSIAASQSNNTTSAIGTCPSTPITKPLGINTNLANTQNMLFQNNAQQQQQMSPNSALKAKLGIQTTSSNYPLNSLQNQLNAFQKQQTAAAAATSNASSSTNLLAAAAATLIQSLPNASNAASNLYNNHNHHNLNHQASVVGLNSHMHHPFAQMSPSTSASTNTASGGSSSSSSTCNLNNTLFVGNLHASLQEIDLIQVFRPFGRIVECCKKWLHFGFVKFTTEEEACHAYVTLNGFRLKGRPMRLEFQNRSKKAKIKAILAQAAAVHGVAAAGLMNLNGSSAAADFNLLSMGSNAQNAQTLAVAASFNSLLTAAATANASSSSSSNSTLDERHLLQQQFQNSTSASNSNMQHQQNQSQYFQQQQQQLQMSSNKQDQLLNSLFSSEQLLKFASSETNSNQQQQQQHQSSVFQLQIPELNFDLISENQSIQQQQQQNLYDFTELDLKLQVDDLHLQNHHHSQNSNFNFLDVNYSTSSGVSSSLSSSSSSSSSHQKSSSDDNIVMSLIKNTISPVESPKHDISSSLSTDSGCRSNSFLNDEDSAICSLAQTTTTMTINHTQKKGSSSSASSTTSSDSNKMMTKMEDFSEHLEFTCSNSSPLKSSALADKQQMQQNEAQKQMVNLEEVEDVEDEEDDRDVDDCSSDCDTSDDASDIPEEQEEDHQEVDEEQQNVQNSSIDSLNDLDLDQITNELHNLSACLLTEQKPEMQMYEALIKHSQVMDKDGCVKRMQLNPGCVYTSVNESHSLFIEPNDVLKKLEIDEVEEYNLFSPSRKQSQNLHDFVDHLLSSMRNQFYLGSN